MSITTSERRVSAPSSVTVILNKALWLTALGVVIRASGAFKEIVFAGVYGVSRDTDAFLLAVTYATFLPAVIGGAVGTALVAHFAGATDGRYRVAPVMWSIAVVGVLCTLVTTIFAPLVMQGIFNVNPDALSNAIRYSRILAPLGVAMILSAAMDALLNSAKQFYLPAISALATPAAMIGGIALFATTIGVEAAAWGMLVGAVAEVAILAARIRVQLDTFGPAGESTRPVINLSDSETKALWRSVAYLTLAGAIAALSGFVDQVFLSRVGTGAITNFNYAFKVNALLVGLFGTALSVAVYPYLSEFAVSFNIVGLKQVALRLAAIVLPITAATAVIVFVFSYPIVDLLYARGKFTQESAAEVASIQRIFALQLVFYVAGLLAMRVLNATRAMGAVLTVAAISVVANTLLDWTLYESFGARGIAFASVATSAISLAAALLFIRVVFVSQRWTRR